MSEMQLLRASIQNMYRNDKSERFDVQIFQCLVYKPQTNEFQLNQNIVIILIYQWIVLHANISVFKILISNLLTNIFSRKILATFSCKYILDH
jgi:hypothetical protein